MNRGISFGEIAGKIKQKGDFITPHKKTTDAEVKRRKKRKL
jgi:hypothetical protein